MSGVARTALAESATPFFEPGEEIAVGEKYGDPYRALDFWKGRRGIEDLPAPSGVRFIKGQMGVVITTRRFLTFKIGGFPMDRAKELLTDLPVNEVDSITVLNRFFSWSGVILTIGGQEYQFRIPDIGYGSIMAQALENAKQGE